MGNLAIYGSVSSTPAEGVGVSGGGSVVPDVGDACSSYIARSAHRSLPVVSATISHTSACKSMTTLGPTRECTRLAHMALHPSWRGSMAPARLSGCICEIGRHGQVLGLQDEALRPRLRRSDLLRHATCIAGCSTRVIPDRSHP